MFFNWVLNDLRKKYKRYFIYMNSMKIFRVHKKNQTVNDFKAAYTAWMSWIYIKIWKVFIIICCSTWGVYKSGVSLQQKLKPCYICVKIARKKKWISNVDFKPESIVLRSFEVRLLLTKSFHEYFLCLKMSMYRKCYIL